MIKVFGVGRGKKAAPPPTEGSTEGAVSTEGANSNDGVSQAASTGQGGSTKRQPGEIRMQKELDELDLPSQAQISFPDSNNIMSFLLQITPEEGYWKTASYQFLFQIPSLYPHEPPKVKCQTPIYHPNIDLSGNVCLNILREEWKPVLSISAVIYGLLHLFSEPNGTDPLNHEAAKLLRDNEREFERIVGRTLRGGNYMGIGFPRLV